MMANSYPTFSLAQTLTREQINFFEEHGFIHFKHFIQPQTIELLVNASLEIQQEWIQKGITKINGVPIKYGKDLRGENIVQRFAFVNQHHAVFAELLRDPRLDILLGLIGPGARIGSAEKDGVVFNHYVNDSHSKFTRMGWHVDGLRDLFHGTMLNPMLNVGIHLSDVKPENGGLRLIPGTHRQSLYNLLFRKKHFVDHRPDPEEVAITPDAGDLTVHDGRLWHRVAQSASVGEASRRRVIYIPIIAGKYLPKNENSPTAFYQRFAGIVK
jgi:phytanoyl-CoA hydroxylase